MNVRAMVIVSFSLGIAACDARTVQHRTEPPVSGLLATVNGVPITQSDVQAAARVATAHPGVAPETERDTLERLTREELLAQRAVQLGLDRAPEFANEDRAQAAHYHAWRRSRLAEMLQQHEAAEQRSSVTDDEARAYYAAHAAQIRTEIRVDQILLRDESAARQALADLRAGAAFEDVARRQFPGLPDGQRPWELGYLHWSQLPDAWHDAITTLQVGQTSDVIAGPGRRFWILRLRDRHEDPSITFDVARAAIVQRLQADRVATLRTHETDELRQHARIVFVASQVE